MKILIQHIENLLPEHDCVVVPGLGGFVQNEVQARSQSESRLFYPASKEIGFNHRLKFNDGLLAQSYQETEGLSFEEANNQIQKAVLELQTKLDSGKFIRMGRTGSLFMIDQQMTFRPDHHNHFYPEAYGLTPFTFPSLKKKVVTEEADFVPEELLEEEDVFIEKKSSRDEFILIRLDRNRMRQLITAAAVCLFFVLLSKPAGKSSLTQEAGMMHNYLSAKAYITSKTASSQMPEQVVAAHVQESVSAEASKPAVVPVSGVKNQQGSQTQIITNDNATGYYIIVSAFIQTNTAKRWIREHEGEAVLKDVGILKRDGRARVFAKTFNNEQEATAFLKEFTSSNPEYASAWIYSAKNE